MSAREVIRITVDAITTKPQPEMPLALKIPKTSRRPSAAAVSMVLSGLFMPTDAYSDDWSKACGEQAKTEAKYVEERSKARATAVEEEEKARAKWTEERSKGQPKWIEEREKARAKEIEERGKEDAKWVEDRGKARAKAIEERAKRGPRR